MRSHWPHSNSLGTRRAGISDAIFCMKSASRCGEGAVDALDDVVLGAVGVDDGS